VLKLELNHKKLRQRLGKHNAVNKETGKDGHKNFPVTSYLESSCGVGAWSCLMSQSAVVVKSNSLTFLVVIFYNISVFLDHNPSTFALSDASFSPPWSELIHKEFHLGFEVDEVALRQGRFQDFGSHLTRLCLSFWAGATNKPN
jgi:hypothetical protein